MLGINGGVFYAVGTEPNPPLLREMFDLAAGGMTSVSSLIGVGVGIENPEPRGLSVRLSVKE